MMKEHTAKLVVALCLCKHIFSALRYSMWSTKSITIFGNVAGRNVRHGMSCQIVTWLPWNPLSYRCPGWRQPLSPLWQCCVHGREDSGSGPGRSGNHTHMLHLKWSP